MLPKLLNFLPMVLGFTQAAKAAPAADRHSATPAEAPTDTPPAPAPAPVPVASPPTDPRLIWEKPIRDFKSRPHLANGSGMGYLSHNVDQFGMATTAHRAEYLRAVANTIRQYAWGLVRVDQVILSYGGMNPTQKASRELERAQLVADRTYWEDQFTLPTDDPRSEYAACLELFRVGYEAGMQRYHDDKGYGDANGLSDLIP